MHRGILFPVLMALIGAALVLLLANHESGTVFGIRDDAFAAVVALSAWAAVLAAGIVSSGRFGEIVRHLAIWAVALLALSTAYLYRYDLQSVGARLTAGLIPGMPITRTSLNGAAEVVLHTTENGHFETTADVDGHWLHFLIDTGASRIMLSYSDARRIGIDTRSLDFSQAIQTANGKAKAAPITIGTISLGPIRRHDIDASVSAPGTLTQSLLGMNFLGTLTSIRMNRDVLVLRD
ncbi:retropepsin-like aspartic protease family protein [Pararhizobium mangrovi]|uniref:TIGR02281 family clan AA aspartic protease n=1 Tax=Pararhizobium mangrovi TaxID=2590452 RepID=A0A506UGP7_9HYPH|nr:TIGR02281 family clan AA aspartic protease [Pararhizobium mangrovi]TPW31287.1 TIGR02281 family clan AA aspartic protease [Pararhizobium mangrovi]